MAKNYTFAEAVKIINAGTDLESIADIGRRYPILLHKVTRVTSKAGDDFIDLMNYMPDYLTANKVNTALKSAVGISAESESEDEDETADVTEAEETTDTKATKEETEGKVEWNESMSAKQLWEILGKAGKRKVAKSTKKADLVEACRQVFGGVDSSTEDEKEEEKENEATESDKSNPYEGKSAMELFKECKKRGIKTAPKKTAKFYADLLIEADAEASKEVKSNDSDDWDEDEDEEVEEQKEIKKAEKKSAKKETTADDDDDWDI